LFEQVYGKKFSLIRLLRKPN